MNSTNSRAVSALAIEKVIYQGQQLNRTLNPALEAWSALDRRFITEIVSGVVRWYWLLDAYARAVMHKSLRKRDHDVYCLLLAGFYQLEFMRVPTYASVSETVDAVSSLGKSWARGLINAVLKKHLKSRQNYELDQFKESSRYSHSTWMINVIRQEWPEHWKAILQANNAKPDMVLRVNLNQITVRTMLQMLEEVNIQAQADPSCESSIRLLQRVSVKKIPGFDRGWVSVQGISSQWVAPTLEIMPGQRILDACAAPGGKTLHILELCSELDELIAIDIDPSRCDAIKQNIERANQKATIICTDATKPHRWWDGKPFDRILIDAPCSAFGIVNKHPDIKHHRRIEDIDTIVKVQRRLLNSLLPLLAKNGKLLYTTCSILAKENERQIQNILANNKQLVCDSLPSELGFSTGNGKQRLQGVHASEGFYYSRLVYA